MTILAKQFVTRCSLIACVVAALLGAALHPAFAQDADSADDSMKPPAWFRLAPPAGWKTDQSQARSVAAAAFQKNEFGETPLAGGAAVYVPEKGGVLLFVTWLTGKRAMPEGAGDAVRNHLQQVKDTQHAASGGSLSWKNRVKDHVAQFGFQWTNADDQIAAMARGMVWFSADNKVRLVRVECRMRVTVAEALRKACVGAISSVRLTVPAAKRAALTVPPLRGEEGKAQPGEDTRSSSIGPASDGKLPVVVHQETQKDTSSRDQWMLIIGVVVVIIAFYLSTRSRRGKIAPETETESETEDKEVEEEEAATASSPRPSGGRAGEGGSESESKSPETESESESESESDAKPKTDDEEKKS